MKIAEAEEKLIQKYSDEILEQFKLALKRVPKNARCQHCYTTAVEIDRKHTAEAIELIQYGLDFCDSWVDRMRSYTNMAILYENSMDYINAYHSYQKALNSVDISQNPSYRYSFSADLMRMKLHIDNFSYSEELEELYHLAAKEDAFAQSFQKKLFYKTLVEIIIFAHKQDKEAVKDAIDKANTMLSANYTGPLTAFLKRKGYYDSIGATEASLSFLKRITKSK